MPVPIPVDSDGDVINSEEAHEEATEALESYPLLSEEPIISQELGPVVAPIVAEALGAGNFPLEPVDVERK